MSEINLERCFKGQISSTFFKTKISFRFVLILHELEK